MCLSIADRCKRYDCHVEGVEERPSFDDMVANDSDEEDEPKKANNAKGFPQGIHRSSPDSMHKENVREEPQESKKKLECLIAEGVSRRCQDSRESRTLRQAQGSTLSELQRLSRA